MTFVSLPGVDAFQSLSPLTLRVAFLLNTGLLASGRKAGLIFFLPLGSPLPSSFATFSTFLHLAFFHFGVSQGMDLPSPHSTLFSAALVHPLGLDVSSAFAGFIFLLSSMSVCPTVYLASS